jgi:hypothetical protein
MLGVVGAAVEGVVDPDPAAGAGSPLGAEGWITSGATRE